MRSSWIRNVFVVLISCAMVLSLGCGFSSDPPASSLGVIGDREATVAPPPSPPPSPPAPVASEGLALDGTSWRLVGWADESLDPKEFSITAEFAEGRLGGRSAINRYNGPFATQGGVILQSGPFIATKMAGPARPMRGESVHFTLLEKSRTAQRQGDRLTFLDENGAETLVFSRIAAAEE